MRKLSALLFAVPLAACLSLPVIAAPASGPQASSSKEHNYYGDISDSGCGAKHKMADAHACTAGCVKNGGKYVFVTHGKVLTINNQGMADLAKYAGEHVRVTGTRNGSGITIASIRPAHRRSVAKKTAS